jgi:hypothetical protein
VESGQKEPNVGKAGKLGFNLRIAAVLVWTAILTFAHYPFTAETIGFWLGGMFIPFIIAYLVSTAWRPGHGIQFSWWFLALGMLLPTLTTFEDRHSEPSHAELIRAIAGTNQSTGTNQGTNTKPLENYLTAQQVSAASVMRPFVDDMRAYYRSYNAQIAVLQPDLTRIYAASSFANRKAMETTLSAVDKKLSLDREQASRIEQWPQQLQAFIDQSHLTDTEKKDVLTGFMKSYNNSELMAAQRQMMSVDSEWIDSVRDLYTFAIANSSEIVVKNDTVGIASDPILAQFNERFTRSKELRDKYIAAAKNVAEIRAAKMKREGVTPADIGVDK